MAASVIKRGSPILLVQNEFSIPLGTKGRGKNSLIRSHWLVGSLAVTIASERHEACAKNWSKRFSIQYLSSEKFCNMKMVSARSFACLFIYFSVGLKDDRIVVC